MQTVREGRGLWDGHNSRDSSYTAITAHRVEQTTTTQKNLNSGMHLTAQLTHLVATQFTLANSNEPQGARIGTFIF